MIYFIFAGPFHLPTIIGALSAALAYHCKKARYSNIAGSSH
jgi:hypothetical protein